MLNAWVAILLTLCGMAMTVVINAVMAGTKFGRFQQSLYDTREQTRIDILDLSKEVAKLRDEQKDILEQFNDLRVKVAAYTGDSNGGVH